MKKEKKEVWKGLKRAEFTNSKKKSELNRLRMEKITITFMQKGNAF